MSLVRAEQAFWSGCGESLKAFSICLLTPGEGSNLGCPLYQAMNLMATCLPPARHGPSYFLLVDDLIVQDRMIKKASPLFISISQSPP